MYRSRSPIQSSWLAILGLTITAGACGHSGPPLPPPASLSGPETTRSQVMEREDITPGMVTMQELLEARIPNVSVRSGGGRAWVEIRGQGTINAGREALIIVDGIELTSLGFLQMSPDDVQRIQVLRGGSAAIYGLRAGNGVLVVTTRRQGQ